MKKFRLHLFATLLVSLLLLGTAFHIGSTVSTDTLTQDPPTTPPGWEKRGKEEEPTAAVERLPWWGDLVDVEYTWISGNGSGVYVVIIDTGLVRQWKDRIPEESVETSLAKSFIGKPSDWDKDRVGHGTSVTSVITGYYYNEENFVLGIAGDVTVIPVRVQTEFRDAEGFKEILTQIKDAIYYAVGLHTDTLADAPMVISMSLGWTDEWVEKYGAQAESDAVHAAIDDAIYYGIIVSVAAGNEGPADNTLTYPAKWEEDIASGSAGWDDDDGDDSIWEDVLDESYFLSYDDYKTYLDTTVYLADYSSRGLQLDIVGPGDKLVLPYKNGQLYWVSGTSFSCPVASAIAALILEQDVSDTVQDLSQGDVEGILRNTAIDMGEGGIDNSWGYGLVQADSAVEAAGS